MERTWPIMRHDVTFNENFSVRIDKKLPGMNEIIAAAKKGFGGLVYARMKRDCTKVIVDAVKLVSHPLGCSKIYVVFNWCVANRRRDPDNIAAAVKFIFDAFVIAGVIKNDSQRYVIGWDNLFTKVDGSDYVEVKVHCQTEE